MNGDTATGPYINTALGKNHITPTINVTGQSDVYAISLVEEASSIIKAYLTADTTLSDYQRKQKGFLIDSLLVSCYYNQIKCSGDDFYYRYVNDYGNCYTFNELYSNGTQVDSKTTSKSGPLYGLNLELFIGLSGNNDYYTVSRGVHVVVHERGTLPLFKNDGVNAMASEATNIAISKTVYSKYDPPYSNCRRDVSSVKSGDSEIYKKTLQISNYYQKLCYELCLQYNYIIPNCSCADPSISDFF